MLNYAVVQLAGLTAPMELTIPMSPPDDSRKTKTWGPQSLHSVAFVVVSVNDLGNEETHLHTRLQLEREVLIILQLLSS